MNPNYRLSPREEQVVELITDARSVKQIAGNLGISPGTVSNYLQAIYAKLDIHSRAELQFWGMRRRLGRMREQGERVA